MTHLSRLSSEDEEVLSPHHHEPHELLAKDLLNLIRLRVDINNNNHNNVILLYNAVRHNQKLKHLPA